MKIIPNSDILIDGKHSPSGVACEASDIIGEALVAQGLARLAPVVASAAVSAEPAPVETAEAAPVSEHAATPPARKRRATATPTAE